MRLPNNAEKLDSLNKAGGKMDSFNKNWFRNYENMIYLEKTTR